jgi:hypothetical protein
MSDSGTPILTSLVIKNPIASDVAAFVGEVARPFAIIITAYGACQATIILATKVTSAEAAIFIGAVFAGLGAIFGAKAWEKVSQVRADAAARKDSSGP